MQLFNIDLRYKFQVRKFFPSRADPKSPKEFGMQERKGRCPVSAIIIDQSLPTTPRGRVNKLRWAV